MDSMPLRKLKSSSPNLRSAAGLVKANLFFDLDGNVRDQGCTLGLCNIPQDSFAIHVVCLAGSQKPYGDLWSTFGFGGGKSLGTQLGQGVDNRTICNQRIMKNSENDFYREMREAVLANSRQAGTSPAPRRRG